MRKKDIMAMLSLVVVSGFVVNNIHDYNVKYETLSACKDECKIETKESKIIKITEDCEDHKREEYINQKVEELRTEKERIRQEEEQKRLEEERQQQTQQVASRGGDVSAREVMFEVSHYCSCEKCCTGATGITASGKKVQEGMCAMPKSFPFGTKIVINDTTYTCEDTGNYIIIDSNGVIRVDIYVSSHEEALRRGRYVTKGIILY